MKRFATLLLLVFACAHFSFTSRSDEGIFKSGGYFMALADNKLFELRDQDKYRAELTNRTETMVVTNGVSTTKVATWIKFYGYEYKDSLNNIFAEELDIKFGFVNGSIGNPPDMKMEFAFDGNRYYHVPEKSDFAITKMSRSEDGSHFLLSADFDCKMKRWGYPSDSQPIIRLKGRMVDINVAIPAWIKVKEAPVVAKN